MPVLLDRAALEAKVCEIAAELSGVAPESVTLASHFQSDLGFDSLDNVEFVMKLEEAFEVDIPDDRAESARTVGDAVELLMHSSK